MTPPTFEDIRRAHERIREFVHRTPVITCETLNRLANAQLFMKAESFQRGGAFKLRGATNAVLSLDDETARRGVATHSSGNHAQALSLAARARGIEAHIVMPENSPQAKIAAVRDYGGNVTFCRATLEARETKLAEVMAATGATLIHPYDDARIIAGQGTATLELIEDAPELSAIVAPVGGGGLLAGTAIAAAGCAAGRSLEVLGAEPELAGDAHRSLETGTRQAPMEPLTIADGLRTALGEINFEVLRGHVRRILLVSEDEILEAMRLVWERAKIVIEPSAAVPVAAALKQPEGFRGKRIGIILSGGNVDLCRNPHCNFWQ